RTERGIALPHRAADRAERPAWDEPGGGSLRGSQSVRRDGAGQREESRRPRRALARRPVARHALRRPDASEESWLYADCLAHTGIRHRSEHGDLQRRQCGAVAPTALSRIGAIGVVERALT